MMKTRLEELNELLDPHGPVVSDVHDTIVELKSTTDPAHEQCCWKSLDIKLERYIQLRIEHVELVKKSSKRA